MTIRTPWGEPDVVDELAEGITWYETPSHGGYRLSDKRVKELPSHLRAHKPFAGYGWYEEDVDWCIVALGFPDVYCARLSQDERERKLAIAQSTFDQWIKPKLKERR